MIGEKEFKQAFGDVYFRPIFFFIAPLIALFNCDHRIYSVVLGISILAYITDALVVFRGPLRFFALLGVVTLLQTSSITLISVEDVPTMTQFFEVEVKEDPPQPTGIRLVEPELVRQAIEDLPWDKKHNKVSIIIPARNEDLTYLQKTIDCVLRNTHISAIEEIILVDDASDKPIKKGVKINDGISFEDQKTADVMQIIRNPTRTGVVKSKLRASKTARGVVLVFLDAHVCPQPHWLAQLLRKINKNTRTIAIMREFPLDEKTWTVNTNVPADKNVKQIFDWQMKPHWFDDGNDDVPLMNGGMFAVTKDWWNELGMYDSNFEQYGSENYELSFRTWLCGGEIQVARDSIIGHLATARTYDKDIIIDNQLNAISLWLSGDYEKKYFEYFPERRARSQELKEQQKERIEWKKQKKCEDFQVFVDHFYDSFLSKGFLGADTFSIRTNNKICVQAMSDGNLEARDCEPDNESQKFSLIFGNGIQNVKSLRCLDAANPVKPRSKLITFWCNRKNTNQEWVFLNGRLSTGSYCAQIQGDQPTGLIEIALCNETHGKSSTFHIVQDNPDSEKKEL